MINKFKLVVGLTIAIGLLLADSNVPHISKEWYPELRYPLEVFDTD